MKTTQHKNEATKTVKPLKFTVVLSDNDKRLSAKGFNFAIKELTTGKLATSFLVAEALNGGVDLGKADTIATKTANALRKCEICAKVAQRLHGKVSAKVVDILTKPITAEGQTGFDIMAKTDEADDGARVARSNLAKLEKTAERVRLLSEVAEGIAGKAETEALNEAREAYKNAQAKANEARKAEREHNEVIIRRYFLNEAEAANQ